MDNINVSSSEPYRIRHATALVPGISDSHLALALPILVHWLTSAFFELCERTGLWEKYRLHTSDEEQKKNLVTRAECFRVTIQCQILQTIFGLALGLIGEGDFVENEDYELDLWTNRVHKIFTSVRCVPTVITLHSLSLEWLKPAARLSIETYGDFGHHNEANTAHPTSYEIFIAQAIYWLIIPLVRMVATIVVADAFMYGLHRLNHTSKWMYKHIHSQHHRLYIPYSWGASYNHPWDSIIVDGLSYGIGCSVSGLSSRLSILLFSYASFKNVLDHCGYVFPWDIMKHITGTDAGFHDVHHQSWGLKSNFGAHFSIWDRLFGTYFDDEEQIAKLRQKSRSAGEKSLLRKTL